MNNPEWISVKERLPEQEGRYLILYRHKDFGPLKVFISDYVEGKWNTVLERIEITHWMPFPEPPKVSDEITGKEPERS